MTGTDILAAAYDAAVEEEYNRLASTPAFKNEYNLITGLMQQYIAPRSTVYDIGSGPGRYTEFLLSMNCKVGALDISLRSLEALRTRINGNYNTNFIFAEKSCATQIDYLPTESADAILIMGPLYHLTQLNERKKSLDNAYRLLKKDGVIFTVFMSTFPLIAEQEASLNCKMPDEAITNVLFKGYQIEQYRCCPDCAETLMNTSGFKTLHMENLNNDFLNHKKKPHYGNMVLKNAFEKIKSEIGLDSQFIYVGKKI